MKHLGFSSVSVEKARLEGEDGSTQWHVEAYGGTPEARNRWGVDGASVIDLISDSLNLKRTEVYDEHYNADGKTSRVKNTEKTLAAQEKQPIHSERIPVVAEKGRRRREARRRRVQR